MNHALNIKNWKDGGNSYILKSDSSNRWTGFQASVIETLKENFGVNFNIIIWSEKSEDDYYCIPFSFLEHLFIEENKTSGKYANRWTTTLVDHILRMKGNNNFAVNIESFYSVSLAPKTYFEIDDDFYIENAKAEIQIRIGQSKFRKGVLDNFNGKCAITGITEPKLLRASHIVPWSHDKSFRGDLLNGILLYAEIDMLFDRGYISLTDELEIIATQKLNNVSQSLKQKIFELIGKKLTTPKKAIKKEYLKYHRETILIK